MNFPQDYKKKRSFLYTTFRLFWLGFFVMLGACQQNEPLIEAFRNIKHTFWYSSDKKIKPEVLQALNQDALIIRLGRAPESLMYHKVSQSAYKTWIGLDRSIMRTKNGILVQTSGPEFNMLGMNLMDSESILFHLYDLQAKRTFERTIDLDREKMNALKMKSVIMPQGFEDVMIAGQVHRLKKVVEKANVRKIHWSFKNVYFVNEENHILKSTQHFHPEYPPIEMTWIQKNKGDKK